MMEREFIFPLKMHVGLPSRAVVKENDFVERGQCIAEPSGLGAKIHSSVSGKVVKIDSNSIHILADRNQRDDYLRIKNCSRIWEYVYEAGVVGAGGAGFPTHIKLQEQIPQGYLIANCVECEPLLIHNIRLLEENPRLVLKGIEYSMEATGASKAMLAIKQKNRKAIEALKKLLANFPKDIELQELPDIYPMGEERAIIKALFNRWLEPTQLPKELGCLVLNTETLANIARAVEDRKPVIDKDITVAGKLSNCQEPQVFFQVPVGTPVQELVDKCGGIDGNYGELIMGGPYTGRSETWEEAVVTKTSGGAIVTIELPEFKGKLGLLVCACGADESRLRDIAQKMKAQVVDVVSCKNLVVNKCKTPGECPGQAGAVLQLKKSGAERILIANCHDCTNTVMNCAPKIGLGVYHHTDHIFRTVNHPLTRRLS